MKWLLISLSAFIIISCTSQNKNYMSDQSYTNALIHSTSPYLLQHAHNPVHWEEWSEKTLAKAKKEDKPIIVSIGYSSCHWCHVMEKESFEDTAVARLMNTHFINIKVDREERPDIDQLYMEAIQTMGINGGWPLNVFLTPDQKPFYGGTYFPNEGWKNLLVSVVDAFKNKRKKIDESAEEFTKSLQLSESVKYRLKGDDSPLDEKAVASTYQRLAAKFDPINGGLKKSPKFPMPSVWQYLAVYYHQTKQEASRQHLILTLEKMARGGIYDHVGGGFARYSTDEEWHVPHFEKMLYDNGQLLSLYANGYKLSKKEAFKQVIRETAHWLSREMLDDSGGFYSALDADSEGEEGKFYVWSHNTIKELSGHHFDLIAEYFDVQEDGNWEKGKNVLRIVEAPQSLLSKYHLSPEDFTKIIEDFKKKALEAREKRIRPGLDSKIIAGWNGLTLSGLSEAYQATGEQLLLTLAKKNAAFIKNELVKNGQLQRFPNKKMEGFMEDYAAVIQAFIKYYETTFEWDYLETSKMLLERVNAAFYDENEHLYYFTSEQSEKLIVRKKELFDNVIPSSNSIMAWNMIHLGTHFYNEKWIAQGKTMLAKVITLTKQEPEYMSNWAVLALELHKPFAEIVIMGDDYLNYGKLLNHPFLPNKILTGAVSEKKSSLFQYKSLLNGKTTIYVCYNKTCKRPVNTVHEALTQLE